MKHSKYKSKLRSEALGTKSQTELWSTRTNRQQYQPIVEQDEGFSPISMKTMRRYGKANSRNLDNKNNAKCIKRSSDGRDSQYQCQMEENEDNVNPAENQVEQLSEVVKNLILKNKLNSKNAFEIPIIDISCLKAVKSNDDSSWTKIANVLQNSSKIYSYRVDFMSDYITQMSNRINLSEKTYLLQNVDKQKNKKEGSEVQLTENIKHQKIKENVSVSDNLLKEVCNQHLEEQKINQLSNSKSDHPSNQMARRMFDQNGVAGILLARLPITRSLNMVIDPNIQFQQHSVIENCHINLVRLYEQIKCFKNAKIFQEVQHFRQFILESKENPPQQYVNYDCYNLSFDDIKQIVLNKNEEQTNEEPIIETVGNEDFLHQQQHENILGNEKNELTQNNEKSQLQLFIPDLQILQEKKIQIKIHKFFRRKARNKIGKQIINTKNKVSQFIDFQFDNHQHIERSQIFYSQNKQKNRPKSKYNIEKHAYKIFIPQFQLTKDAHYLSLLPLQPSPISQTDIKQIDFDNHNLSGSSHNKPFDSFCTPFSSNESVIYQIQNIKNVKLKLWDIIKGASRIQYSQLYESYEKQKGYISQAMAFLSLLHLCNDKNLQIRQKREQQFQIINHNCKQF